MWWTSRADADRALTLPLVDPAAAAAAPSLPVSRPAGVLPPAAELPYGAVAPPLPSAAPQPPPTSLPPQLSIAAVATFENSRLRRAVDFSRRIGGVSLPAVHWAGGALGASMVASSMAYSTRKNGTLAETALAETAAGIGASMYLSGIRNLLEGVVAGPRPADVARGLFGAAAITAVVISGTLLGSANTSQRLAGAALYAGSVDGVAKVLSLSFEQNHDVGDPQHVNRTTTYLGAVFAAGCLLLAMAVGSGLVWRLGAFGVTGAMVFGVTAGAHVLLSCCGRVAWVLYSQFRAAEQAMQAEGDSPSAQAGAH